jgi:hypothetical protein
LTITVLVAALAALGFAAYWVTRKAPPERAPPV